MASPTTLNRQFLFERGLEVRRARRLAGAAHIGLGHVATTASEGPACESERGDKHAERNVHVVHGGRLRGKNRLEEVRMCRTSWVKT